MFKGFNLEIADNYFSPWIVKGRSQHSKNQTVVRADLNRYFDGEGVISATKMGEAWFPTIKADVFISHSHADSELAIGMAGWLEEKFGLNAFVDSTVWGYSETLLRKIDNKYCWNENGETYNYLKRNKSTSHVHTMLTSALHTMIDVSECVMFLNSPNSVSCKGYVTSTATHSPWIFSEISMTRLIERKLTRPYPAYMRKAQASAEALDESLQVKYDLPLSHLIPIGSSALEEWSEVVRRTRERGAETLDSLYEMFAKA